MADVLDRVVVGAAHVAFADGAGHRRQTPDLLLQLRDLLLLVHDLGFQVVDLSSLLGHNLFQLLFIIKLEKEI